MRKTVIFGMLVWLFLFDCLNNPEPKNTYSLYFPIEVGKEWNYYMVWTIGDSLIESNVYKIKITDEGLSDSGYPLYELSEKINSVDTIVWKSYYEKRKDGLYLYASEGGGLNTLWKRAMNVKGYVKNSPVLLVPFEFRDNEEWRCYDTLHDTINNNIEVFEKNIKFVGREEVQTKAGIFNCFKFETKGYFGEKREHYYADGIGMVMKRVIIDSFQVTQWNFESTYKKSVLTLTLLSY